MTSINHGNGAENRRTRFYVYCSLAEPELKRKVYYRAPVMISRGVSTIEPDGV